MKSKYCNNSNYRRTLIIYYNIKILAFTNQSAFPIFISKDPFASLFCTLISHYCYAYIHINIVSTLWYSWLFYNLLQSREKLKPCINLFMWLCNNYCFWESIDGLKYVQRVIDFFISRKVHPYSIFSISICCE